MLNEAKEMNFIEDAIQNKKVFWGTVTKTFIEEDETETMVLKMDKNQFTEREIIIRRNEADINFKTGFMNYLVGFPVTFVMLSVNEDGTIEASRKQAMQICGEKLKIKISCGKPVLYAQIVNFTEFGAIVSVGGTSGILKNTDYSLDYSHIDEYLKIGDYVNVYAKKIEKDGKFYFEAVDKVHRDEIPEPDFDEGDVLIGEVINIKNFNNHPYAFVNLGKGLQGMAYIPDGMFVREKDQLAVKITSILPSKRPYVSKDIKVNIERNLSNKKMSYKPLIKAS